jgi:hypothetical protein
MGRVRLECSQEDCVSRKSGHPKSFRGTGTFDANGIQRTSEPGGAVEEGRADGVYPEDFQCVYCRNPAQSAAAGVYHLKPYHRALITMALNKLEFKGHDGRKAARIKSAVSFDENRADLDLLGVAFQGTPAGGIQAAGLIPQVKPEILRKSLESRLEVAEDAQELKKAYEGAHKRWESLLAAQAPAPVEFYAGDLTLLRAEFPKVEMPGVLCQEWYELFEILEVETPED